MTYGTGNVFICYGYHIYWLQRGSSEQWCNPIWNHLWQNVLPFILQCILQCMAGGIIWRTTHRFYGWQIHWMAKTTYGLNIVMLQNILANMCNMWLSIVLGQSTAGIQVSYGVRLQDLVPVLGSRQCTWNITCTNSLYVPLKCTSKVHGWLKFIKTQTHIFFF